MADILEFFVDLLLDIPFRAAWRIITWPFRMVWCAIVYVWDCMVSFWEWAFRLRGTNTDV